MQKMSKEELINKGMKFGGDSGNVINKKLGEQVNVKGGITDTNKLATGKRITLTTRITKTIILFPPLLIQVRLFYFLKQKQ